MIITVEEKHHIRQLDLFISQLAESVHAHTVTTAFPASLHRARRPAAHTVIVVCKAPQRCYFNPNFHL